MKEKTIEKRLVEIQKQELLAMHMYERAASIAKNPENAKVLNEIAEGEKSHAETLAEFSGIKAKLNPVRLKISLFFIGIAIRIMGITFVLKYFERNEAKRTKANKPYLAKHKPEVLEFIADEESHEQILLNMINEDRLNYVSSIVLGLNDALVELKGALAGFTLSMQNSRTIAVVGLITGISASFSMAASEYLSTKSEENTEVNALKSAAYTGLAYVFTVIFLILPFLLISNYVISLIVTMAVAVVIIALFNYYISVVRDGNFGRQFGEMAAISIGVALLSFFIGFLVNKYIGIDI